MAYACPACGAVEADAEHLANHLAVTASLHEDDHAAWLEDHARDWPERSPEELGETVIGHAEERRVEPSTDARYHEKMPSGVTRGEPGRDDGSSERPDPETERILRAARELTRRSADDTEE